MRWVDELLTDEVPKWARDTVQESLNARDVEIAKQYDEIKSLRAEVESLSQALQAANDGALRERAEVERLKKALQTVGDDYPGSFHQQWCYEQAGIPLEQRKKLDAAREGGK